MAGLFQIVDVVPLGDFDRESHIVTLHHHHSEGEPGIATARFGSLRAGQSEARCLQCGSTTTVIKENGGADIYIREEAGVTNVTNEVFMIHVDS